MNLISILKKGAAPLIIAAGLATNLLGCDEYIIKEKAIVTDKYFFMAVHAPIYRLEFHGRVDISTNYREVYDRFNIGDEVIITYEELRDIKGGVWDTDVLDVQPLSK